MTCQSYVNKGILSSVGMNICLVYKNFNVVRDIFCKLYVVFCVFI